MVNQFNTVVDLEIGYGRLVCNTRLSLEQVGGHPCDNNWPVLSEIS
jgi:hypothetical protein